MKTLLPHTWPVFFARHGRLTAVQQQAIPPILAGRDTLVIAPTASGKTEAVVAPLLERLLADREVERAARAATGRHRRIAGLRAQAEMPSPTLSPAPTGRDALRILYLCPTRALVRDLHERLARPLEALGVTLAMKSGDTGAVSARRPPTVLITTPESLDALLTRAPRLLAKLKAVVLDEIHLLDGSVRGDHLRCLLARIDLICTFRRPPHVDVQTSVPQRIALSATIADPAGIAARYLADPEIVQVGGGREIVASGRPLVDLDDLVDALDQRASHKTLIFCNTRNEVEQVANYLRAHLTYEAPVFTHYANIDPAVRREVETRFAEASVAVCVSSSTLELGIDIGSIDDIVLIGPPHSIGSFWQRIGRGGRRGPTTRVLCLARSPGEELRFAALLEADAEPSPYHFKPSVLVQQVFSLLKQSPTGGLRLADLRAVAPAEVADDDLPPILAQLSRSGYLVGGRPGEWRPGPRLNELADLQAIFSNIGDDALGASVVDAFSGQRLARADRPRQQGEDLLLGGRQVQVAWRSDFTFGVRASVTGQAEKELRFRTAPYAIPLDVAQAVARHLGFAPGEVPCFEHQGETWLFHFWGDLFGALVAAVWRAGVGWGGNREAGSDGETGRQIESLGPFCLRLSFPLTTLPPWDEAEALRQVAALSRQLEPQLELGRFHRLLPPDLASRTLIDHCDLPQLAALIAKARLVEVPRAAREMLLGMV